MRQGSLKRQNSSIKVYDLCTIAISEDSCFREEKEQFTPLFVDSYLNVSKNFEIVGRAVECSVT